MTMERQALGKSGEDLARRRNSSAAGTQFLRAATARGMAKSTSWRGTASTTVFVEVKARATAEFGTRGRGGHAAEAAAAGVRWRVDYLARHRLHDAAVPFRRRGHRRRSGRRPSSRYIARAFEAALTRSRLP